MKEVVFLLRTEDQEALGNIRCFPGLMAAADGSDLWLRGIALAEKDNPELCSLPVLITYLLDENDLLFPVGAITPVLKLKKLNWLPLQQFIPVTLPVSPLPAKNSDRFGVRLKKSIHETAPFALLTSLENWKQYAGTAPEVRLGKIQFAVSGKNEVLLIGNPLPSLPGSMRWKTHDLLLPGGYDFDPPLLASLIQTRWNEKKDAFLLFDTAGNWQVISKNSFVAASRSAARLSPVIQPEHG